MKIKMRSSAMRTKLKTDHKVKLYPSQSAQQSGFRLLENGDYRLLENGDFRLLE